MTPEKPITGEDSSTLSFDWVSSEEAERTYGVYKLQEQKERSRYENPRFARRRRKLDLTQGMTAEQRRTNLKRRKKRLKR